MKQGWIKGKNTKVHFVINGITLCGRLLTDYDYVQRAKTDDVCKKCLEIYLSLQKKETIVV